MQSISVNGQRYIAKGNKAVYKAQSVEPATANNRSVQWFIQEAVHKGVTINRSTGQVEVYYDAVAGDTYHVYAVSADGSRVESEKTAFTVTEDKLSAVEISAADAAVSEAYEIRKTGESISGLKLFNQITAAGVDITSIELKGKPQYLDSYPAGMLTWSTSNPKVVDVAERADGETAVLTATGKGTATITCAAQDGSGKKATVSVTVAEPVKEIKVTGQTYVLRGASATYKAVSVTPATAANRNVKWELRNATSSAITMDEKTGKITVAAKAPITAECDVYAVAKDGSGVGGSCHVKVCSSLTNSVKISTVATAEPYKIVKDTNTGKLRSAQLYTVDAGGYTVNEQQMTLWGNAYAKNGNTTTDITSTGIMRWISSNEKVVKIGDETTSSSGSSVMIRAAGTGKAVITCEALDGSGKKDTVTVSVVVPVSDITIGPADGMTTVVGSGRSVNTSVAYGDAYGKPTTKSAEWSYKIVIVQRDKETGEETLDETQDWNLKKEKLFTLSGRRLTAGSDKVYRDCYIKYLPSSDGDYTYDFAAKVTARSGDRSGAEDTIIYKCCPLAKYIGVFEEYNGRKLQQNGISLKTGSYVGSLNIYNTYSDGDKAFNALARPTVVSSDTAIATAYCDKNGKLVITSGKKTGKATLTITATDGGKARCKFTVTVHK